MRVIIILVLLVLSLTAKAQEIRVKGVKMVTPEDNRSYLLTGVVPGSRNLLVAGEGYNGLSMLDTRRGRIRVISSEPGAGYEPATTDDGMMVFYRSDSFENNRKHSSVYSFNIASGEKRLLADKERGVLPPAVSGNAVFVKSDGKMRVEQSGTVLLKGTGGETFLVIEEMMPVLYSGEDRKPLMPNGEGFYIWASLSPDGSMILYNYQGKNTWICDTSGKVLHDLGRVNAPRWLNNDLVIGMDDKDDGHMITSSELVYYSLPEKRRSVLTNTEERSEMFPFPFGDGKKIAFSTDKGEIYVMKIRIR
ncbi:MAG: PD40 domain-containing protein [Bacteroidales bacterium]|nr:PD40 domain-containing protein [Bacteroidales bacterium]